MINCTQCALAILRFTFHASYELQPWNMHWGSMSPHPTNVEFRPTRCTHYLFQPQFVSETTSIPKPFIHRWNSTRIGNKISRQLRVQRWFGVLRRSPSPESAVIRAVSIAKGQMGEKRRAASFSSRRRLAPCEKEAIHKTVAVIGRLGRCSVRFSK